MLKSIGMAVIMVLIVMSVCYGGDSVRISVSCTIPAIPGVNAPLLAEEEDAKTNDASDTQKQDEQKAGDTDYETAIVKNIQQDKEMVMVMADVSTLDGKVTTVYSR